MNDLASIIKDRERELDELRRRAEEVDVARNEEERERILAHFQSLETQLTKERAERDAAIQKAARDSEQEATIAIQRAKEEFEGELRKRELQILDAFDTDFNDAWRGREESLKREFRILLSDELDGLKAELSAHYEGLLGVKDEELVLRDKRAAEQMAGAEEKHQRHLELMGEETERMAEVLWHEAYEQFNDAAEETIAHERKIAEKLRSENSELQTLVRDKEKEIEARERDLVEMQRANALELADMQRGLAESVSKVETSCSLKVAALSDDVEKLSNEKRKVLLAYEEAENACEIMREELGRVSDLELRYRDQTQTSQTFAAERDRLRSQVGELTACKDLLTRQAADLADEKAELVERCRALDRVSKESKLANDGLANEIARLSTEAEEARRENKRIGRELGDAKEALAALKRERRESAAEADRRLKQKDEMLADALASINRSSSETTAREPVVVHLHGDQSRVSGDANSRSELNELRSKVLRLQRENLRLESASASGPDQRAAAAESNDQLNERVETLVQENARLKRMIQMMRKELEGMTSAETLADDGDNKEANKSRENAIDKTSSLRERELIKRLEETTDEVEVLIRENDHLLRLSNDLRTKLLQCKPSSRLWNASSSADTGFLRRPSSVADRSLDDAILAETSMGNIDDVEEQSVQQACVVGGKPPLVAGNADSRPSRTTAYVS